MAASDRVLVLVPSTTATSSSTGDELNIAEPFTSALIYLNVSAASGTSPTLNVYVQEVFTLPASGDAELSQPTGTKFYDDIVSFTQATSTGTWVARIVGGGNVVAAKKDASLSAGSCANGPIGSIWRVKYVIAGTSPSFTFSVSTKLIP